MGHSCKVLKMIAKENVSGNVLLLGFDKFCHWHPELELIYMYKGSLTIDISETKVTLKEKEFLVISSNILHFFEESSEGAVIYVARLPIENIRDMNKVEIEKLYEESLVISNDQTLRSIFNDIMFANYKKYNELYITAKVAEFTINLLGKQQLIVKRIRADVVEESDTTVEIRTFIEESLKGKITLSMLAERLNMSKNYCSMFIKQKTGFKFLEYVNQVRLREAEKYLRTTNMQIMEICYAVGFDSIQSFNRNFKKVRGITPTQYRKGIGKF